MDPATGVSKRAQWNREVGEAPHLKLHAVCTLSERHERHPSLLKVQWLGVAEEPRPSTVCCMRLR